jgi:hypothetical protein
MCAQCECKRTLFQKHDNNVTRSWQIYEPKTSVGQIKNNVGFYLYLYPLDTVQKSFSINFQPACGPCSPMCDPYAPMCDPCPSMWKPIMNYNLTKNELRLKYELIES